MVRWNKMVWCSKCNRDLDVSLFYIDKSVISGHQRYCKDCVNKYKKEEYHNIFKTKNIIKRIRVWATNTLSGHRRRGYIINITINELINYALSIQKCEICNKELDWFIQDGTGNATLDTPSLDRINNELEININNIQIVCKECNSHKQGKTMKEFILYCKHVIDINGDIYGI